MFISNNRPSFHLWLNENLVKHQKVSKYYENDCRLFQNPNFPLFYELGKTCKYTVHSPRPTLQNPNFESMDELAKVMS